MSGLACLMQIAVVLQAKDHGVLRSHKSVAPDGLDHIHKFDAGCPGGNPKRGTEGVGNLRLAVVAVPAIQLPDAESQ